MEQTTITFYPSKVKVFLAMIIIAGFTSFTALVMVAFISHDSPIPFIIMMLITLVGLIILLSVIRALIHSRPSVLFTETYFILGPKLRHALKVYYKDIDYLEYSDKDTIQSIKVALKDEAAYFDELSAWQTFFHGQNKLVGVPLVSIPHKGIKKRDEPLFYTVMEDLMALTEGEIDSLHIEDIRDRAKKEDVLSREAFISKIDPYDPVVLRFDLAYFKSAYLTSFIYFVVFLLFGYFTGNDFYVGYVLFSFITYPFGLIVADMLGFYKVKERKRRGGLMSLYYNSILGMEFLLYHISLFLFPIGLLILLIRFFLGTDRKTEGE